VEASGGRAQAALKHMHDVKRMNLAQKQATDRAERLVRRQGRCNAQQYALATLLTGDGPEGQEDPPNPPDSDDSELEDNPGIMAFGWEPPVPDGGVVAGLGANVAEAGPPPPLDGVGPVAEHGANEMEGNVPNNPAVAAGEAGAGAEEEADSGLEARPIPEDVVTLLRKCLFWPEHDTALRTLNRQ